MRISFADLTTGLGVKFPKFSLQLDTYAPNYCLVMEDDTLNATDQDNSALGKTSPPYIERNT